MVIDVLDLLPGQRQPPRQFLRRDIDIYILSQPREWHSHWHGSSSLVGIRSQMIRIQFSVPSRLFDLKCQGCRQYELLTSNL